MNSELKSLNSVQVIEHQKDFFVLLRFTEFFLRLFFEYLILLRRKHHKLLVIVVSVYSVENAQYQQFTCEILWLKPGNTVFLALHMF